MENWFWVWFSLSTSHLEYVAAAEWESSVPGHQTLGHRKKFTCAPQCQGLHEKSQSRILAVRSPSCCSSNCCGEVESKVIDNWPYLTCHQFLHGSRAKKVFNLLKRKFEKNMTKIVSAPSPHMSAVCGITRCFPLLLEDAGLLGHPWGAPRTLHISI